MVATLLATCISASILIVGEPKCLLLHERFDASVCSTLVANPFLNSSSPTNGGSQGQSPSSPSSPSTKGGGVNPASNGALQLHPLANKACISMTGQVPPQSSYYQHGSLLSMGFTMGMTFELPYGQSSCTSFVMDVVCTGSYNTATNKNRALLGQNPFAVTLQDTMFRLWSTDLKAVVSYSSTASMPTALYMEAASSANPPSAPNYLFEFQVKDPPNNPGLHNGDALRQGDWVSLTSRTSNGALLRMFISNSYKIMAGTSAPDTYGMYIIATQ